MDQYWVEDSEFVYLPCSLDKKGAETVDFRTEDGKKITIKSSAFAKCDQVQGEQLRGVDDVCSLSVVSEAALLHTVRMRYLKKEVYTNVTRILIAMNPFMGLPIYNKEYMDKYMQATAGSALPPHIYAIGQDALDGLRDGTRDQAVLISGESGAGKTESAKLVLSYVAEALKGKHGGIEELLLRTNPVLESFGNAMTVRNNNSSRFGKWLDIKMEQMQMKGVSVASYLLEVTRVCKQGKGERNYHVFFQLLQARESKKLGLADLKLNDPKKYRYTKDCVQQAPGIDDGKFWADMSDAFKALNYSEQTQKEIARILAGILELGNCDFKDDNDEAKLTNPDACARAAEMFMVDTTALQTVMTHKTLMVGKEATAKPVRGDQAPVLRDSISRKVYGKLFLWLIQKINEVLGGGQKSDACRLLGVLDIAGFESFEINSLEQLLINLSNEHLQQQFNNTVFKSELDDSKKEGIELGNSVDFKDNADVLELLDSKGSILEQLDEAVSLPKCTDLLYVENCLKAHAKHPRMIKPKFPGKAIYGVKH
jgi:myosin heavy subunit